MRWGLIGASDIAAHSIIPAIRAQPDSSVAAVYSRSADRGAAYARERDIDTSHDSLEALLSDASIDAVYVSTTNERHCEETIAAAQAGKHVLCEKPLALSLDDAAAMIQACRSADVVLATNHGRRHDSLVRAARDVVQSGRLGTPIAAQTSNCVALPERLRGWRLDKATAGAGVVLDLVVHEADTLRFILADEPSEVTAFTSVLGAGPDAADETVLGVLTMESGLLASFACAFGIAHGQADLALHGTDASLFASRVPGHATTMILRHEGGEEVIDLPELEPVGHATIRAFEAAVRGETAAPAATGEDGLRSLAVALGTIDSARNGRTVTLNPPS